MTSPTPNNAKGRDRAMSEDKTVKASDIYKALEKWINKAGRQHIEDASSNAAILGIGMECVESENRIQPEGLPECVVKMCYSERWGVLVDVYADTLIDGVGDLRFALAEPYAKHCAILKIIGVMQVCGDVEVENDTEWVIP